MFRISGHDEIWPDFARIACRAGNQEGRKRTRPIDMGKRRRRVNVFYGMTIGRKWKAAIRPTRKTRRKQAFKVAFEQNVEKG